ncbi:MAG: T9SS type A sorting domain-containing protein [Bacteroidaceae bacterium]|nr:T9SS type A sorting domain-containing protein [Bacteroidaceae bacterium]
MKLKTLAAIAALTLAATAHAGTAADYVLNIHMTDATVITCDFANEPVITFADQKMTLETKDATQQTWEIEQVDSWTFTKGADAIESVTSSTGNGVRLTVSEAAVTVSGAEGTQLRLVSLDGKLLQRQTVGADGTCSISTANLTAGTYIFAAGGKSVKLIVK